MALQIELHSKLSAPVDGSDFVRTWTPDLKADDVRRQTAFLGNQQVAFGELFTVRGDFSGQRSIWCGDFRFLSGLAAFQSSGETIVEGQIGHRAGWRMQGGRFVVLGDAGDDLGTSMTGGTIFVSGSAGDRTGGCGAGESNGLNRGTIFVEGNCGDAAGLRMRRGTIAVGGSVGNYAGFQMVAGTLLIGGHAGKSLAHEMKRGTVFTRSSECFETVRFHKGHSTPCGIFGIMANQYEAELAAISRADSPQLLLALKILRHNLTQFSGDHLHGGKGEILIAQDR